MKKVVIFVVLAMLVIGFCAAQSSNNDAQRLVGTWVSDRGLTYVLNANGTGTSSGRGASSGKGLPGHNGNIFWGVSVSGILVIVWANTDHSEGPFYLSPDGRGMIWDYVVFQKK